MKETEVPLTEAQRIIKQNEVIGGLLIDKRKLEKENERLKQQLKEERNKAVDGAINVVRSYTYTGRICRELESLKSYSK